MNLQIEISYENNVSILNLKGEIDVYTSPKLKEKILSEIETGHNYLIINLSNVSYIDSTGLGVLIGALRRCKEKNGDVFIIYTNPRLKRIFEITGLNNSFKIFSSHDDAIKSLGGVK